MKNPFIIGNLNSDSYCDREKEIDYIYNLIVKGTNIILSSPKRYGKTTLVHKALNKLNEDNILTFFIDLFTVFSKEEFIRRFATGFYKGIAKGIYDNSFINNISSYFEKLYPVIEFKGNAVNISVKFDKEIKFEILFADLLQGIHKYLNKYKLSACIALDEFQKIKELEESKQIESTLQSFMQLHNEITFIFIGSQRQMINEMFTRENNPLNNTSELFTLKEIPKKEFSDYIYNQFNNTGKKCNRDITEKIYDIVQGYPYYVEKLSSLLWDITENICVMNKLKEAYNLLLRTESTYFESIWSSLTTNQKTVLKAIALGQISSPYSTKFLNKNNLSLGGVQKAIKLLVSLDLIERDESKLFKLTDPIMNDWLFL